MTYIIMHNEREEDGALSVVDKITEDINEVAEITYNLFNLTDADEIFIGKAETEEEQIEMIRRIRRRG